MNYLYHILYAFDRTPGSMGGDHYERQCWFQVVDKDWTSRLYARPENLPLPLFYSCHISPQQWFRSKGTL